MSSTRLHFCGSCGTLDTSAGGKNCFRCGEMIEQVDPSSAVPLVGFVATGKSVYLATLHDQLMHGAPQWGVEVNDHAFSNLTRAYSQIRRGELLPATMPIDRPETFLMKVRWDCRNQLDLLMWDIAGESWRRFADGGELDTCVELILSQSRALFFSLSPQYLRNGQNDDVEMAKFFRRLLKTNRTLKQVEVLLIGSDEFGRSSAEAHPRIIEAYEKNFRLFPGVLKNAGVIVEPVPLTNFGFGNKLVDGIPRFRDPPEPHNVLEPLRRVLPRFRSWWHRWFMSGSTSKTVHHSVPPTPFELIVSSSVNRDPSKRVFISYRRGGGAETARLIRKELEGRGWRPFLDVEDMGAGYFDDRLLLEIQDADHFVLILSPGSLDRCADRKDWVRREVTHAITHEKRIIPVLKDNFTFPKKANLPTDIRELLRLNCVEYSHTFFQASMDQIVSFLSGTKATVAAVGPSDSRYVKWKCPACGKLTKASEKLMGKKVKCPGCGKRQKVPDTAD